ncbi:MAG TPA: MFS transporter [Jatrophihabitantaceae bacterium]|jgi:EmrB/QacA subfamily drug resistance transporter
MSFPQTAQRRTLAVACVATAMLMLDIAVINTAIPKIATDLHAGLSGVQWVIDAYTLTLAAAVLTAGSLADRFGRKRSFIAGLTLFTASSLACGLAGSILALDVARAVQGVGAAIMFATALALIGDAFPSAKERAGALAVYGATIGASFAIGPLVGGALTSWLNWPSIFFVNLPIGIACIVAAIKVPEARDPFARKPDLVGQALLGAGLFLLILALLRGNEDGWTSTRIVAELSVAGALLIAFVVAEAIVKTPMLPLRMFRNPSFTGAQLAAFAISSTFFAVFIYMTLYLQNVRHLSPVEAGLVYLPGTMIMLFVSAGTANLHGRVSARSLIVGGLLLVAAGMSLIVLVTPTSSWALILPGEIVALIGTGMFNPALSEVVLREAGVGQSGLAAGVNDTFRQAGIAVGVAALGALIPAKAALGTGSASSYVDGLHNALLVGAGFCVVAAVACVVLIKRRVASSIDDELDELVATDRQLDSVPR